jgi:negative regulator of replication initiation
MKTIELSDETYAALARLATDKNLAIGELLAALVREGHPLLDRDNLLVFFAGDEFRALADREERYLALLAWCATNHASDFADFISHQESGHRYLMLSRDEVQDVRAHNHARQIDGTQYWAVTIDPKSKRRFVRRLLEFIGCRDETVAEAHSTLGLTAPSEPTRLLGVA